MFYIFLKLKKPDFYFPKFKSKSKKKNKCILKKGDAREEINHKFFFDVGFEPTEISKILN